MSFASCAARGAAFVTCVLLAASGPALGGGTAKRQTSGIASWYGKPFHGRLTANGERFNMNELTAAHRTLPFGSKVRVTNRDNNKSVVVRINDRGPFVGKRVIDLSRAAASALRMMNSGVARVKLEVLAGGSS
jgi:rare lipoprotein A